MNKNSTRFFVDIISAVLFLFLLLSGLIMHYVLPPGSGRFQTLAGMSRHQWGEVHFVVALMLLISISVHISLHWKWVTCMGKRMFSE